MNSFRILLLFLLLFAFVPAGAQTDTLPCDSPAVFIPNTFTPNCDGINCDFLPRFSCIPVEYHLQVFDRWGALVWETRNYLEGWDGRKGKEIAQTDNYIYRLKLRFAVDAETRSYAGNVTLIR